MNNKRILILGGGTFQPISNHLSLSAPAFGKVSYQIHEKLKNFNLESEVVLTKMANPSSTLMTNEDVATFLDMETEDPNLGIIIISVAFCDYMVPGGNFHNQRLETSNGMVNLQLTPTEKIIDHIRRKRPDIFLVGFKTTTNEKPEGQFLKGLKMMKRSKCNLVLANDTITRNNIIITPEETWYPTKDRSDAIDMLCEMISTRGYGTYNKSIFIEKENVQIQDTPLNFQLVVKGLIEAGAFIVNNGNGFTPGHFCWKNSDNSFYSSQRKVNHNSVFHAGMSLVTVGDKDENGMEVFTVSGDKKASVGARSQWLILQEYPEYDCIVHTHSPIKLGSLVPTTPQKPYQCGSLECGLNTLNNMGDFGSIKSVYLEKHGPNILFKSTTPASEILDFIRANFDLNIKTT